MIGKKKNVKKNTEPKEYNLIAIGLSILVVIALAITAVFVLKNRKPVEEEKLQEPEKTVEKEPEVKPTAREILEKYVKEKVYEDELEKEINSEGHLYQDTFIVPVSELYHKEVEYCIEDLNQDESEELLVRICTDMDYYYTYLFSVKDEKVQFVAVKYLYGEVRYSQQMNAIISTSGFVIPETQECHIFEQLVDTDLVESFRITKENGVCRKSENEQVAEISQEEFDAYLNDSTQLQWESNGTLELERIKAEAIEFEAPTFIIDVPKGWTAQMEYYPFSAMMRETEVPVLAIYKGTADKANPYILISAIEVTGIGGMPNPNLVQTVQTKMIGKYEPWISQYGLPPFTVHSFIINNDSENDEWYYDYTFLPEKSGNSQYLFDAILHDQISIDCADISFMMNSFRLNPIGEYTTHGYHERFDGPSLQANKQDTMGYDEEITYYVYEIKEVDGITWYRTGLYTWIADGQGQTGTYEPLG